MASGNWQQTMPPPKFAELWAQQSPGVPAPAAYQNPNGLTAFLGREPVDEDDEDIRWHISVRYGDPGADGRIPTWEECVATAHELRPGVAFVIGIPPRSWWMNVHPHVLHLYETRDPHLIATWRGQRMAHTPS
jgi:hypothetical protein